MCWIRLLDIYATVDAVCWIKLLDIYAAVDAMGWIANERVFLDFEYCVCGVWPVMQMGS